MQSICQKSYFSVLYLVVIYFNSNFMSEESKTNVSSEPTNEVIPEVVSPTTAPETKQTEVAETKIASASIKELSTPIAIVIAGLFIGGGLYFSGGSLGETSTATTNDPILDKALAAGVDKEDFSKCYQDGETLSLVEEDIDNAVATGGKGTPWGILIGPGGKKYPIGGALPQQSIEQLIELAKSESALTAADTEDETLNSVTPVTAADHIKGDVNAPIKIVEYSDFDCPYCIRFGGTMKAVTKKYSGTEVAWVYRHFPIEQLHPNAKAISVASECVAKLEGNDAFWIFAESHMQKF